MNSNINVTSHLKKLADIATWFDEQQTVDVEEGLKKVKEAAVLIKESKQRLQTIENEFIEIKKTMENESEEETFFPPSSRTRTMHVED